MIALNYENQSHFTDFQAGMREKLEQTSLLEEMASPAHFKSL